MSFIRIQINGEWWQVKPGYMAKFVKDYMSSKDRNKPCACGSGLKFKKCCGRLK